MNSSTKTHAKLLEHMSGCWGVQREEQNNPTESKGLKCEDYQPHPEDQTELMLTFKLSPSLHLLFIHCERLHCRQESKKKSAFPIVESYRPHLDLICKLDGERVAGCGGMRGHREQVFWALWWKRRPGGWVQGNWRSRCLPVSGLGLVFVRRAGIQLEQIRLQGTWAHLTSPTFIKWGKHHPDLHQTLLTGRQEG